MYFNSVLHSMLAAFLLLATVSTPVLATSGASIQPPGTFDEWVGWGGNVYNNRWNTQNKELNSSSIQGLVQNCKLDYLRGVAATPVVVNYTAYYPTVNGSFCALNYVTCEYEWTVNVTDVIWDFQPVSALTLNYSLLAARTSPQIDAESGVLYFGTQALALLVAVDLFTGKVLGTTQVNSHPLAICTISPTFYNGKIFIGASSHEDAAPNDPNYKCCTFIGNFGAWTFDRALGKFNKVWEVQTLPSGQGWAGAGVWGPQPSIDPNRSQVFFGTGQLMLYPDQYTHCKNETVACLPDNVYQDSVLAVDVNTGKVNWHMSRSSLDHWLQICGPPNQPTSKSPLCPGSTGPDGDFGMAPAFVPAAQSGMAADSVVVGQKTGYIYNIDAASGTINWLMHIGANTAGSWLSWGLAVDGSKVYYTGINYGAVNWTLTPSGVTVNNSAFGALDLKTGAHIWETACPDNELAYSPPGLVNDLVFVSESGSGTTQVSGNVLALSSKDGSLVQKFPAAGVLDGGIVARGGFLMFGSGYAYRNAFANGSFYVFALPGALKAAKADLAAQARTSLTMGSPTAAVTSPVKKSTATRKEDTRWSIASRTIPIFALMVYLVDY